MSENDPKKAADDELDEDDEFESLSQDEKAAFEKIMAEIAEAEAGDPPPSASSSSSAEEPDTGSSSASTEDAAHAASDTDVQEPSGEDTPQASVPETESDNGNAAVEDPTTDEQDEDEALDEDQQAALDAIMAEIEGGKVEDKAATEEQPAPEAEVASEEEGDENLDEDQQAALDAIMAEIEGKKSVDKAASTEEPTSEEEPAPEAEGASEEEGDEDLSEDQQAALDAIMAEIEGKRKMDTPPTEEDGSVVEEDDSKQGLSMEEFNNELSSLLNAEEDSSSDTADEIKNRTETVDDEDEPTVDTPLQQPEEVNDAPPHDEKPAPTDFPILKEVSAGDEEIPKPSKQNQTPRHRPAPFKKIAVAAVVVVAVLGAVWGGYGAIQKFWMRPSSTILLDAQTTQTPPTETEPLSDGSVSDGSVATFQKTAPPVAESRRAEPQISEDTPLMSLASDLDSGRQQLQSKLKEIEELMAYYQNGINEERQQLETLVAQHGYRSFDEAIKNAKVSLALQAIQRRKAYADTLSLPLREIQGAVEELQYLERRAQIYVLLTSHTSGVPISDFIASASQRLQTHMGQIQTLGIGGIDTSRISLQSIWNQFHQKPVAKTKARVGTPLDAAISEELCNGDYSRRNLLTTLTPKSATCMLNWHGKDMFLNGLTELPPSVAKILAQWKGDWLSLNGIKELSPESAAHLAKWSGKRLSLNGLIRLSPKATANLSQWQGEQIEMIGLIEIGPWKNYGTRLFLSETLKQRLEVR